MKQCNDCKQFLPLTYFYRKGNGYRHICRSCWSEQARIINATTEAQEKRRERHRKHARFKNYGITKEMYDNLLEKQGGMCMICGDKMSKPCIDHDHKTGHIRGILCHGCNTGIGLFKENPERLEKAIEYLRIRYGV